MSNTESSIQPGPVALDIDRCEVPIRTVGPFKQSVRRRMSAGTLVLIGLIQLLVVVSAVNASSQLTPRQREEPPQQQPQQNLAAAGNYTTAERQQALTEAIDEFRTENGDIDVSLAISIAGTELTYGDDAAMETASAVKLEILVRWLALRQDGALPQDELGLARDMITNSSNDATNALCTKIAGIGHEVTVPGGTNACVDDSLWGMDETTASDALRVVDAAFGDELLTRESRGLVRELTGSITPEQAWGVSSAANEDEAVYLKNGWDARDNGWVAHSVGLIQDDQPLRIAVLTDRNGDFDSGVTHVERLAELARQAAQGTPQ